MHVPKAAGSAIIDGMLDVVRPMRRVRGFDRVLFGSFNRFDTLHPDVRRHIHLQPDTLPADADFIAGHFALSTILCRYPEARLVTVLREPMSRLLSHWTFWRGDIGERMSHLGDWAPFRAIAHQRFGDFLGNPKIACQTDNLIVRMLLWPHPRIPDDAFIESHDEQRLESEALDRLRQFSHLNIVENPSLAADLSAWLGAPVRIPVSNQTPQVAAWLTIRLDDELSAETWRLWRQRTRLDRRLWLHVASTAMPGVDAGELEAATQVRTVARHAELLSRVRASL